MVSLCTDSQIKAKNCPKEIALHLLTMRIKCQGIFSKKGCKSPQCDQVMEFSWSALWNITDETPDNCQMFLNCRGMSLFLECLQVSPLSPTLHLMSLLKPEAFT